jgi:hypothetical protein
MPPTGIRKQLIDVAMDMYVEWRESCVALGRAYEQWSSVPVAERKLAFAVYRAALDLEEHASAVYADRLRGASFERVATKPPTPARAAR